mgnify:CR=1 FL=1
METGQKIRYERKKQGLSMKKLGEAIGLSEQAIAHYEKGTRRISFDTLKKIANVLNLPISAFNPDNIEGYTDFGNGIKGFGIGEKITLRNMIYSLYDPYMGMGKEEILNMCEKAIKILKLYNLEISFITCSYLLHLYYRGLLLVYFNYCMNGIVYCMNGIKNIFWTIKLVISHYFSLVK